ncbi:CPBP family intramembrane metalloprotease [Tissierella sp. MSJ-40]|uniref:CPBP family intramembrane metalloprotease n=1 Tax=Tissierella simiarum TaxID=2841534 RepID=A0ABS6E8W1_9FIRM|nr:CPBP family intramembrane glutamic endopeptidase [Tissierella simiarum]MBU5439212.1 CPBP family intramembrane metalloprotease [Tissierella simiarum]
MFDSLFVSSAVKYNNNIEELLQYPMIMFIRVCLLAPIVEEILIRAFVLETLRNTYTTIIAIIISTLLFALLHFNFVQTLSAMICGLVLGLIYIKTNSLSCCILIHALYNFMSYISLSLARLKI